MYSTSELYNKRVFIVAKNGVPKKYGRLRSVVFHPNKPKAVGVIVKRPDLALMVKRKDRFVALDRIEIRDDGPLIIDQVDTWDSAACKRMGIEYEKCILWDYMPVRTASGRKLGEISNVFFDEGTFAVDHIDISSGGVNRTILGSSNIDVRRILGYDDGSIVVVDNIGDVEESGGAAAKAGEAWASVKHKGSQAAKAAGEKAGESVDKGAYQVGKALGTAKRTVDEKVDAAAVKKTAGKAAGAARKQLGRATHMFKDFKDEFDKASQ